MDIDKVALKKVLLQRDESYCYSVMLENGILQVDSEYALEYLADCIRICCTPFTEKLDFKVVEYPADAWQHFKKDYFPEWLLRKYPVLNNKTMIDIKAAYPLVALKDEMHWVYTKESISDGFRCD